MTHGSDYLLVNAPGPIKELLGYSDRSDLTTGLGHPDSIIVYEDIIQPIFDLKCVSCHNDKSRSGGLNMSTPELLSQGGDHGVVIAAGDLSSELFSRVTLPVSSSKFMPSSGLPMSYHEVKLLEWWIYNGADFTSSVSDLEMTPSVLSTLTSHYHLDEADLSKDASHTTTEIDSMTHTAIDSSKLSIPED